MTSTHHKGNTRLIYDPVILFTAFALIAIGLLMVASASMVVSDRIYHSPFHFLFRQIIYLGVGFSVALFVVRIPIAFWKRIGASLLFLSLILLALVLVPGIGHEVNGSKRWIGLGIVGLQVSEVVKMCIVIYMAGYIVRHHEEVKTHLTGFVKPMILLGFVAVFLMLEPDFGATVVIMATALGMLFLAGVRLWQFAVLLCGVGGAMVSLIMISPYRLERLTAFLNPWANQFDSGYQLTQSLIAFGRGGLFGVGLGNSIQKLFYLPEAHTDFLFAVLGEEFGLLGEVVVTALFVVLVMRILSLGRKALDAQQPFESFMCYGFGLWLGLQFIINIGVNMGVLPTKGLTLPFMSYGGSSMMVNCVVIAIVLRIHHEVFVHGVGACKPIQSRRRARFK